MNQEEYRKQVNQTDMNFWTKLSDLQDMIKCFWRQRMKESPLSLPPETLSLIQDLEDDSEELIVEPENFDVRPDYSEWIKAKGKRFDGLFSKRITS